MAYDLLRRKQIPDDWSLGSDLPAEAKGYAPETYWNPAQMEAKLASIMNQPKHLFGGKPSREEAIVLLARHMKDHKIGPMDVAGGSRIAHELVGSAMGSMVLPAKQETRLMNKIDDVRYDVRSAKGIVGAGIFALAGAVAWLGFAKVYKAAKGA